MIRSYYWHERIVRGPRRVSRRLRRHDLRGWFRHGNAGDLFAKTLLEAVYGVEVNNVKDGGNRLLTVGSIVHKRAPGDVLCGVGAKHPSIHGEPADVLVWALRGPRSFEVCRNAGLDVSTVRFLADPGLLIRNFVDTSAQAVRGRIAFVPHYRDPGRFRALPRGVHLEDIDAPPLRLARGILRSEVVLTSSLHGLIFAHSLGRPCVLLRIPATEGPFKYEDYLSSVGVSLSLNDLPSVEEALSGSLPVSPTDIDVAWESIEFPEMAFLRERRVICG